MEEEKEETYEEVLDEELRKNAEGTVLANTLIAQVAREKATGSPEMVEIVDEVDKTLEDIDDPEHARNNEGLEIDD